MPSIPSMPSSDLFSLLNYMPWYRTTAAIVVCLLLAIAGGLAVYFVFLSPKNEHRFTGFVDWVYQFLHFRKLLVEALLKVTYVIVALFFTLYSIYLLFTSSFLAFLFTFVGSNLVTRLVYEFLLFTVLICRNTSEINSKLSGSAQPAAAPPQPQGQPYAAERPAQPPREVPAPAAPQANACPKCGTTNESGDVFCANCGNRLR